jgi:hypothetical protein
MELVDFEEINNILVETRDTVKANLSTLQELSRLIMNGKSSDTPTIPDASNEGMVGTNKDLRDGKIQKIDNLDHNKCYLVSFVSKEGSELGGMLVTWEYVSGQRNSDDPLTSPGSQTPCRGPGLKAVYVHVRGFNATFSLVECK